MTSSRGSDPAERHPLLRFFYSDWRPTRMGRWVNRFASFWSGLGLPPRFQVSLEVRGRVSGRVRATPVVIATVDHDAAQLITGPEVVTRGWIYADEAEELLEEMRAAIADAIVRALEKGDHEPDTLQRVVRKAAGRFVNDRTKRRPMIVPVVMSL